jgi:tetratricopeptide (TPR) repeat protein/transcriptional regulator with XRE-family HTH domain
MLPGHGYRSMAAESMISRSGEMSFAHHLRLYRVSAGLTQETLAELSGMGVRTIRDLELGRTRHPRRASIDLLADTLRLTGESRRLFTRIAEEPRYRTAQDDSNAPNQLPADASDFTGRATHVQSVIRMLTAQRQAAVVVAVSGRPGVGKTALAVHVAHFLGDQFPDGRLYASLRGIEVAPREPAELLASLLRALGVDGRTMPRSTNARAELYRSLVAERRLLVVLDNAANEGQVRALLPGSSACAVVITSRARLTGLESVRHVELDMLDPDEALELLGHVAGEERIATEPEAAMQLVRLCDRLPLAIRIAGARLAARPSWKLARFVARLADEHHRLDELVAGDLGVRASIALSYDGLDQPRRLAFRRLGLLDAPDLSAWSIGALLEQPIEVAEELVESLVDAALVEHSRIDVTDRVRYRCHDLLRLFAYERAQAEESAASHAAALARPLQLLAKLAEQAALRLVHDQAEFDNAGGASWEPDAAKAGALLADSLAWFDSERQAALSGIAQACREGLDDVAYRLATSFATYFAVRGYFDDWRQTHVQVLDVIQGRGNLVAEAALYRGLGDLHTIQDRYEEALTSFRQALSRLREAGDRRGQAAVLHGIGSIARLRSDYTEALTCFREAFVISLELDDSPVAAYSLHAIGNVRCDQRRYAEAFQHIREAISLSRKLNLRIVEARALRGLGLVYQATGQLEEAWRAVAQGLAICREVGDRPSETNALQTMGEVRCQQGQLMEARLLLEHCLATYRELGDRFNEAFTIASLGRLERAEGHLPRAIVHLGDSERRFAELGLPLWRSRSLISLAVVYEQAGDESAASVARREAHTLLLEVGLDDSSKDEGSDSDASAVKLS